MNDNHGAAHPGPVRDFVGYGPEPPDFECPVVREWRSTW